MDQDCLDELVLILKMKEADFYHVDPSDITHQRTSYGAALILLHINHLLHDYAGVTTCGNVHCYGILMVQKFTVKNPTDDKSSMNSLVTSPIFILSFGDSFEHATPISSTEIKHLLT